MKQEVRRGRKFVEYHDPETQDEFTFTQEISGADVSYQETDGSWHPADENWATDGVDGFILKNDKLNHKVRLKGTGGRTWYPRRNVNTEYMTFGVPQYRNGNKWRNFSFSGWSVDGKTITLNTRQGVTILVHNRWNGIKIDWVLASSAAPSRMRYPVSLTGITYVDGIIYGADGTRLGQLTPTTATDANEAELPCSGSYSGGYVEFQADMTGAVYPVVIDPDFAGGTADGMIYGRDAGGNWTNARATAYNHYLTDIAGGVGLDTWSTIAAIYRLFFVFVTDSIGSSSTVTQVNLKFRCTAKIQTSGQPNWDVQIVKYDWSGSNPITSLNRETAYDGCLAAASDDSIWKNTADISANNTYTSGNLSTTWVNKSGLTYYGLRSSLDYSNTLPESLVTNHIMLGMSENTTESYRPVLIVTYTSGSTGTLLRVNMNAQMQSLSGGIYG